MILLDTNVVSELIKPAPDAAFAIWFARQSSDELWISAVTEAELRFGAAILPPGRRKDALIEAISLAININFLERILPFDSAAAKGYASLVSRRRAIGTPISQFDGQIAAIAKSRSASIATRNTADFVDCGIDLVNPWLIER